MAQLLKEKYQGKFWNPLPKEVIQRIKGKSWREGCPVPLEDLAYLQLNHWNFQQKVALGELVCHKNLARELIELFQELFELSFPIERMRLIEDYGVDDERSMQDNNSSAFNFREIVGDPGFSVPSNVSLHSYGGAIDINPALNPYVTKDQVYPLNSEKYLNRSLVGVPGMIKKKEGCFLAFAKRGYAWGGDFDPLPDYHHFYKEPTAFIPNFAYKTS